MLEKLQAIVRRLEQVERQLSDPAIYADRETLTRLSREQKELTPIAAAFRAWQQAEDDCAQAQELLTDPEMRELAQEELRRARQERDRLSQELKTLLLPRDPNDDRNVILEVRAGIGGEEGALFAADLLRMYALYAERRGWHMEPVYENTTELGGVKEASVTIEGQGAWSRLKFEAGTHRVQRVPETESSGRIQTSAATVAVMPEAEEVEFTIDPKDLQIDTFRSSGIRHPHHPPAHRHGGGVPGRTQPVQKQGPGHENSPLQAVRGPAGEAERRHCRPAEKPGRHRRPVRQNPHL